MLKLVISKVKTTGNVQYFNVYTSKDVESPDQLAVDPEILKLIDGGFVNFTKVNHARWDMEVTMPNNIEA